MRAGDGDRKTAGDRIPSRAAGSAFAVALGLAALAVCGAGAIAGGRLGLAIGLLGLALLGAVAALRLSAGRSGAVAAIAGEAPLAFDTTLLDYAPTACLITRRNGSFEYANAAYRNLVGAGGGDIPPTLVQLLNDSQPALERLLAHARAALEPGRDEGAERADGRTGDGEGERDPAGHPAPLVIEPGDGRSLSVTVCRHPGAGDLVLWFVDDLSHSPLALELGDERGSIADYLDNAPVGFYSIDPQGRFQFVNATLARWLGWEREDLVGGDVQLRDVLVREAGGGQYVDAFPDERPLTDGERGLRARGGQVLPVHITQTVIRDAAGAKLGSRAVVRELTTEQEWQDLLRRAELHFRRFFDAAPVGIVTLDRDDRVVEGNPALLALLDTTAEKFNRRPIGDYLSGESRQQLGEHLKAVREAAGELPPIEVQIGDAARQRTAQVYARRLAGTNESGGLLLHLIDTSEQKMLELRMVQGQKMQAVGQLAGGVAHDFNNLLTAMIGFCDLLLLRHEPGDQSFSDIMQIKQNANRAANLVRQLLAFSRQQTLRPKVLVLTDVLAELSNLLRRLMGERIALKVVHGRDLGLVRVDQGQFEQVVINLAVNARDAMRDGGDLTIATENLSLERPLSAGGDTIPPGDYVVITVRDTGHGIAKDHFEKIFEPFFTTKEVGAGTGLGLSTVYGIIKQTGGFIVPESTVGAGTTFTIYLPRHQPEAAEVAGEEAGDQRIARDLTGKGTVLLVEDEDPVRLFAARALKNKGYEVLTADSGESALEVVRSHQGHIDLLVSDVVMPQMDGPTLVSHVLHEYPAIKVIFISGYAEDTFRRSFDVELEDIDFLPKPFSLEELAGKVKEVMESRRP
ncbi:hybrid sensor histidine kinase/response regulator [Oceanibacterium hippocampi]|uniref:histidine kinase n=1 Tax=Oceanibacterium hippocampi TaxID=745714 RepID=A0A1Y5U1K9_9PROT|nr:PAS domain-containing sensor histidine kinase [Oceanibacterium hippocampi]SLN76830.1 Blue-light-activated protein [Oceanibacterium hippocampi]